VLQHTPLIKLLTAAAVFALCRRMGGWMMLLPMLLSMLPLLVRLISELRRPSASAARSAS
jgi:hypothetical protein